MTLCLLVSMTCPKLYAESLEEILQEADRPRACWISADWNRRAPRSYTLYKHVMTKHREIAAKKPKAPVTHEIANSSLFEFKGGAETKIAQRFNEEEYMAQAKGIALEKREKEEVKAIDERIYIARLPSFAEPDPPTVELPPDKPVVLEEAHHPGPPPAPLFTLSEKIKPQKYSLGAGIFYFAGDKTSSLSSTTGYFLESETEFKPHSIFYPIAKMRLTYNSGSSPFTDGGTVNYSFLYLSGAASLGAKIYGSSKDFGRPYVKGLGTLGFSLLKFTGTTVNLQPTGAALGVGYEIGVGMEFKQLSVEFNYLVLNQNLAGKSTFSVGGFGISLNWILPK